jgi:hypothetical protein
VQVQKHVGQHDQHSVAVAVGPVVTEDRLPDLRFGQPIPRLGGGAFLWSDGLCISHIVIFEIMDVRM